MSDYLDDLAAQMAERKAREQREADDAAAQAKALRVAFERDVPSIKSALAKAAEARVAEIRDKLHVDALSSYADPAGDITLTWAMKNRTTLEVHLPSRTDANLAVTSQLELGGRSLGSSDAFTGVALRMVDDKLVLWSAGAVITADQAIKQLTEPFARYIAQHA